MEDRPEHGTSHLTFSAAPALQTAMETPRIALAPTLAANKENIFSADKFRLLLYVGPTLKIYLFAVLLPINFSLGR